MSKKLVSLLLIAVFLSISSFSFAFALGVAIPNSEEKVLGKPTDKVGTIVTFVDANLSKTSPLVTNNLVYPMGTIHEGYDHSYYYYDHSAIYAYNVGPRCNDIFLISVARGTTKTLTTTKTVSGTIVFTTSVEAGIQDVVKAGFGLTSSGTYTYTWSLTQQFTGPPAPYNSRDYYGAINYDLYSVYVKRYDVYRVYNGNAMTGYNTYYQGLTTVNGVKIPKAVQYSVDSIQ
ncbi:hypothetical protein [Thermoanaerobacterium sp. RBIITD]|uniref:hypothetical protein n=1 Tax=Thermoanaerobacterium sp. RBIITD TaxID=1550240 RepID=UPI000BB7EB22|nr:hypothetical protein [Thermoanaerobacterium sp. RBIITD]SNX53256.1 hypothetical protein SAMN05660242_0768 [Thermoanaerobacterium sp. RBIITD]